MNPLIFDSNLFTLYSLWFFICLGLFIGIWIFLKLAIKSRLRLQFIADVSFKTIVGSLIIGRIVAVINNAQYYFYNFNTTNIYRMIAFWQDKDISFWGTILGAIFIFTRSARKKQENIEKWSDIFMVSILSALTIGNFGAYLDGINHGKVTSSPLGVTFSSYLVKYTEPVHPTQLYAMFYCFILAIILYSLYKKYRNTYDGLTFILGLSAFSFFRFLEGFFRGDEVLTFFKIRFPELSFFFIFLYSLHKLYLYNKKHQVPLLKTFSYYYSKFLNLFIQKISPTKSK